MRRGQVEEITAEDGDEAKGTRPSARTITLPTLRFGYRNKPVTYRDGRLFVDGRPVKGRRSS